MTLGETAKYTTCADESGKVTAEVRCHGGEEAKRKGLWLGGDESKPSKRLCLPAYRSIDPPAEQSSTICSEPALYFDSRMKNLATNTSRIDKTIDKGKGKEGERGRTLERGQRLEDPLARATSRVRSQDAAIELDMRPIGKRISRRSTFFEDPSDPRAILEDELLEPMPSGSGRGSMSSVSEILQRSLSDSRVVTSTNRFTKNLSRANTAGFFISNSNTSFNIRRPSESLDTVFNDRRPFHPVPTMPPESLVRILPNIDHLEYLAIESSPPFWSSKSDNSLPQTKPDIRSSIASGLPTEILHQIFRNLGFVDFNSARHTCRNWFVNSLERCLLETMLERGGWSNYIQCNLGSRDTAASNNEASDEWLMSKRISRECALGPDWTGNGIREQNIEATSGASGTAKKSPLVLSTEIDFTEISVHYAKLKLPGIIFTVSSCGRFLMVANGCLIYIYELNRNHKPTDSTSTTRAGFLQPVTSIICPRQVIACSMDTSSHRYAVAALLDGRMGIVCDITGRNFAFGTRPHNKPDTIISSRMADHSLHNIHDESYRDTSFLDRVSLNSSASHVPGSRTLTEPSLVFSGIATTGTDRRSYSPAILEKGIGAWQDALPGNPQKLVSSPGPSSRKTSLPCVNTQSPKYSTVYPWTESGSNIMRIESGPRSIYRNLCSDDDPPRSVAICPQRRCVAFGCSAGIELHWVDALTGQDLNRWFPLTAPSDYLFFLPPRKSVDSAKKLRLISSAARPGERSAIGERAFGGKMRPSPFWERFGWGSSSPQAGDDASQGFLRRLPSESRPRTDRTWRHSSDHYRAIPLSDGYHILFTDPATGLLCLGSDAPVGGPTKLLRKIWFKGPAGAGSPVAYASGSDLSYGVRVVAAFGNGEKQSIWLFSVPSDIFAAGLGPQSSVMGTSRLAPCSAQEIQKMKWVKWWPDEGMQEWLHHMQNPQPGILPRSVWPIEVRGQKIGTCRGLVDLALDSGPDMTVWAFSKEGIAKVWRIDYGRQNGVEKRMVVRDGTVRECDGEGDVEMCDASTSSSSPEILYSAESLLQESSDTSTDSVAPASFDGTASLSTSTIFSTDFSFRYAQTEYNSHDTQVDSEGDVLMEDLPGIEKFMSKDDSNDMVMSAHHRGKIYYQSSHWSGCSYRTHIAVDRRDIVEELTGIARIDIEVR